MAHAVAAPQSSTPRGMRHIAYDFRYFCSNSTIYQVNYLNWCQQQRENARSNNRHMVTVAILGNKEVAHNTATVDFISRRLALCKLAEEVRCRHNFQPVLLMINFSSPLYNWEVFRQQAMAERLHHLDVDLLLLAPGQESLEVELRQAPTTKQAIIQWRRELRRTVLALQGTVKPRQGIFLNKLPAILVILPPKSK